MAEQGLNVSSRTRSPYNHSVHPLLVPSKVDAVVAMISNSPSILVEKIGPR